MSSAYNKLISTAARSSLLSHIVTAPVIKLYYILIFAWKKLLYFSYEDILQEKIVKMTTTTARDCADYSNPNESFWYSY